MLKYKKVLLASSALLLFSLSAGIASAAEAPIQSVTKTSISAKLLTYQIKLRVGETYQLPYGRNYIYVPYQGGSGVNYFSVSSTGLVTALRAPLTLPGEPIGYVGVVQNGVADIAEVYIEITD
ncbi:hypothetical protein GCM10008014_08130 [Paenibacillus silvae]|uniref:Uncharacterized protein n=1 Tax=Paenibacillus silvae TaxID=1325358 RepID=A0ABQ1Z1J4_9BACL|nr:hypothetical protein [Paenibacillus silvae]GGH45842.1 hypothetical protein GCM10008014_08130 [Paenibacillus silvae]